MSFIAIILILGIFSIYETQTIAGRTKTLYDRPHTNLIKMVNIETQVEQVGVELRDSMLKGTSIPDETKNTFTDVLNQIAEIDANKVDKTQAKSENIIAIEEAIAVWSNYGNQIISLLESGKSEEISDELYQSFYTSETDLLEKVITLTETASANALKFRNQSSSMAVVTLIVMIVLFVLAIVFAIILLKIVVESFTRPMDEIGKAAEEMSKGSLNAKITYAADNEIGQLALNMNKLMAGIKKLINDIGYCLGAMAEGDFTVSSTCRESYIGDYEPLLEYMRKIAVNLSEVIGEIKASSVQVASGSANMAEGAQHLAIDATDEASAVEELTATVNEVTNQVEDTAEGTRQADERADQVEKEVMESSSHMKNMTEAMLRINETSSQIEVIMKTIEDIASQTNLLSLNASIEAARAGEAGRGFAVVAGEIGQLANQSAQAANNTRELIQASLGEIKKGNEIVKDTSDSLNQVVYSVREIRELVGKTKDTTVRQATSMEEINKAVEQIANVIENTSATAQESSATSEELSAQAEVLNGLVEQFKVRS